MCTVLARPPSPPRMSDRIQLHAEDGAMAEIHRRGAHLTRWQPAGSRENRLFVSERALYADGVPIRGGVPVIFPQFAGEGPLPKHGFARTASWRLREQGRDQAVFEWGDDEHTRAIWPQAFAARLSVTVGGAAVTVALDITNTGSTPFQFTAALHTYLAVQHIDEVRLQGLQDLHYRDTAQGGRMAQQADAALRIEGEVDRNYFATPPSLVLQDGPRTLRVEQRGFVDTVVWNPGAAGSASFKDLAPEDYQRFLCIEAATIAQPVALPPGGHWRGSQRLIA